MSAAASLVVVGSANQDLVVRCEHIPRPGETVLGDEFMMAPGGKGANQAAAGARLGARVHFVGRVGSDTFGDALTQSLEDAGVDTTYLKRDPVRATGVALIGVDASGQNSITVAPGANYGVTPEDIDAAYEVIKAASCLVIQLEIPLETVEYAVSVARRAGVRVLLNPAPVRHTAPLSRALLQQVDILTPNEHEAANLLGFPEPGSMDMTEAAMKLLQLGPRQVVVTLGSAGCVVAANGSVSAVAAPEVTARDTTAAGDCFTGALAVLLAEGADLAEAAAFGCRAAALSVTRVGAQSSLPTRQEVERFREAHLT